LLRLKNEKNGKTSKEAINNIQFCRIERSNMTLRPVFRSNVIENPQPVASYLRAVVLLLVLGKSGEAATSRHAMALIFIESEFQ
jgi:hypothetical protein